jgi:hypothetical protein
MNERGPGPSGGEDPKKKDDDVPMPPDDPARGPPVEEPPSREPPKRAEVIMHCNATIGVAAPPLTSAEGSKWKVWCAGEIQPGDVRDHRVISGRRRMHRHRIDGSSCMHLSRSQERPLSSTILALDFGVLRVSLDNPCS